MEGISETGSRRESPLLIYTISYLSGILAGSRIFVMPYCLLALLSVVLTLALLLYYNTYCIRRSVISETVLSHLLPIIFFLTGWINIQHSDELQRSKENSLLTGKGYMFAECILSEKPVRVKNSYRVDATVAGLREKTILYLDKRFDVADAEAGDTLRVLMKPTEIKNFYSGFDYAGMLEKEGIYSSSFIRHDKIELRKCERPSFRFNVIRLKNKYVDYVRKETGDEHLSGILIALTTGDKRYLERETRNAFSASGTMHVLAVSGLHTALLFSFLSVLLCPLGNRRFFAIFKYLIQILFLCGYTLLTGLSPSVCRASVMLAVHRTAALTGRGSSLVHSLALSALIITILKPDSLFEPGFQLSYAALLSIIYIHPQIHSLYKPPSKAAGYIWSLLSMSTACQIGTALIIISAFGNFPLYFLPANLIVIPLTSLILALSVLALVTPGYFSGLIYDFINFSLRLLDFYVSRIDSLPFSSVKAEFNSCQLTILTLLIISFFLKIPDDKRSRKIICAGLLILFVMNSLFVIYNKH